MPHGTISDSQPRSSCTGLPETFDIECVRRSRPATTKGNTSRTSASLARMPKDRRAGYNDEVGAEGSASPVVGTLEAIMAAQPGNVLVIDHGGRMDINSWGGIATFTAVHRGLVGVVIDGVTRDVDEMKVLGFPAYGKGIIQQSIRSRCAFAGHSIQVQLDGVPVRPGDLVMGDDNGVIVVPQKHISEVLKIAQVCAETEEKIKDWIAQGVNPVEAHERVKYDQMTDPAQRLGR